MAKALLFENEPCGRCAGSGRYSFNLMHGDRCYGCSGNGVKLTKRGAAAQKYYNELRSIRADQVEPGMVILDDRIFSARWRKVAKAEPCSIASMIVNGVEIPIRSIRFTFEGTTETSSYQDTSVLRRKFPAEEAIAMREKALAYQATLTKAGVPAKNARSAA